METALTVLAYAGAAYLLLPIAAVLLFALFFLIVGWICK